MEQIKIYKTKENIRIAVKKYTNKIKEDTQKYDEFKNYHRAYNKTYYNQLKNFKSQMILLQEKNKQNTPDLILLKLNFDLDVKSISFSKQADFNLDNICFYPITENKLVYINSIPKLKYLDGVINTKFLSDENEKINQYSDNIDLLIIDIVRILEKKNIMNNFYYSILMKYLN